jgi:hypothetical protein
VGERVRTGDMVRTRGEDAGRVSTRDVRFGVAVADIGRLDGEDFGLESTSAFQLWNASSACCFRMLVDKLAFSSESSWDCT